MHVRCEILERRQIFGQTASQALRFFNASRAA